MARDMQPCDGGRTKSQIDQGVRGLGGKAVSPIGFAQPVADFKPVATIERMDAAAAHEDAGFRLRDRVDAIAHLAFSHALDKVDGVFTRAWLRMTAKHTEDAGV